MKYTYLVSFAHAILHRFNLLISASEGGENGLGSEVPGKKVGNHCFLTTRQGAGVSTDKRRDIVGARLMRVLPFRVKTAPCITAPSSLSGKSFMFFLNARFQIELPLFAFLQYAIFL